MKINTEYNNQSAFKATVKNKDISIKLIIIDYQHNTKLEYSISSFFLIEPSDKSILNSIKLPKSTDKKLDFLSNLFKDGHSTVFLKKKFSKTKDTKIAYYKTILNNLKNMDIDVKSL